MEFVISAHLTSLHIIYEIENKTLFVTQMPSGEAEKFPELRAASGLKRQFIL